MIKYLHNLTEEEFKEKCVGKMTYGELAKKYPQPKWCSYPDATEGLMGCWSLMSFMVRGRSYCKCCQCYVAPKDKR